MQATASNIHRTYIPQLGVTVDRIAPGKTFERTAEADAAVESCGCCMRGLITGMVPERMEKGSRSTLYRTMAKYKAKRGFTHFAFAVGPLECERWGERGGRKIILGVMPK